MSIDSPWLLQPGLVQDKARSQEPMSSPRTNVVSQVWVGSRGGDLKCIVAETWPGSSNMGCKHLEGWLPPLCHPRRLLKGLPSEGASLTILPVSPTQMTLGRVINS